MAKEDDELTTTTTTEVEPDELEDDELKDDEEEDEDEDGPANDPTLEEQDGGERLAEAQAQAAENHKLDHPETDEPTGDTAQE